MQIPQVTDLQATADGNRVNLSWSEPTVQNSVNAVIDDMESYTPFAISGIGNYTLIDNDNTDTYTVQGITGYDNAGAKMAYQASAGGRSLATNVLWHSAQRKQPTTIG